MAVMALSFTQNRLFYMHNIVMDIFYKLNNIYNMLHAILFKAISLALHAKYSICNLVGKMSKASLVMVSCKCITNSLQFTIANHDFHI